MITKTSLICSELWVLPVNRPFGKIYFDGLQSKVIGAFNQRTGTSQQSEMLFSIEDEITLVESGSGFIRVRFDSCGPNSKLGNLVKYFASFD